MRILKWEGSNMLFREDLEKLLAQGCACCKKEGKDPKKEHSHKQPLYFHAKCHIDAPPWSYYKNGIIHIECSVCRQPIFSFQVASKG